MDVQQTEIAGVVVITPDVFRDDRGFFFETFNDERYRTAGVFDPKESVVQGNLSQSHAGVLRGLHYQVGSYAQGKLIMVLSGRIRDVAVDIRQSSPTFKRHVSIDLDAQSAQQFFIPRGCAHGFVALEDHTTVAYVCTASSYAKNAERGIAWNDPDLNINWSIDRPHLSDKDRMHPLLRDIAEEDLFV